MLKAKACQRCREMKPVADFTKNRSRPDGLAHYCRPCTAADAAKRYAARPEVVRKAARDWYAANRERKLASAAEYRAANAEALAQANREYKAARRASDPEKVRAEHRAWRQQNAEHCREYVRLRRAAAPERHRAEVAQWTAANREAANEIKRRYKARKRAAAIVPFSAEQLAAKVAYWGGRCWMCGDSYEAIDHVKPLAKGGPHLLANLRPACAPCNHRKRDTWPYSAA